MNEIYARQSIAIAAPAEVVFACLTQPELTKEYMFGCGVKSDFKPGSKVLWEGVADGKPIVYVTGTLLAYEPGKRFDYTTFDPFSKRPDVPENHLTVTNTITPAPGGGVTLAVSQGDYRKSSEPHTEAEANEGWQKILQQIKALAERQAAKT